MQLDILARLSKVYPEAAETHVPVLLTGSGTSAVEAMVQSFVPRAADLGGKKALVIANGVYGDRIAQMLTAQSKPFETQQADWTHGIDLAAADMALGSGQFACVLAIHHETTTGRLNDIAGLGALAKKHNVPLLLDGVSSFAGEEILFDAWNIDACAATANKCLHGVPGISFVIARKSLFTSRQSGSTSVYLDLYRYRKEQEKGFSPFTQSVHVLYALAEALRELEDQGGWKTRHEKYAALTKQVQAGLAKMDIPTFLESPSVYSSILVSYRMPKSISYDKLHDDLKRDGFIIYAGQGPYMGQIFRIAVMGDIDSSDMDRLLAAIRRSIG